MQEALNLDMVFTALADPTRRAILTRLASGEATVMELAQPFEMTQPAISQHLKVLENAGLVTVRIDGTKRPRQLAKQGIKELERWMEELGKSLEKSYQRLDRVLAEMDESGRKGGKRS
jgi:DNA-binding transcriptional ArsR family regulator